MPIEVAGQIQVFSQEQFHALDRKLIGIVFDVHNRFGRFFDEELYKAEIAHRWINSGSGTAEREVRVTARHGSFSKDYRMDLLLNHGLMLEAKTAEVLTPAHRTYGLNYLLLAGMRHGRLINLRPDRAQHEYLSTRLTPDRRRDFKMDTKEFRPMNDRCLLFQSTLSALLEDWGAFLELGLYKQALTHFLGGMSEVVQNVPVLCAGRQIGVQKVHLLSAETAFSLTSLTTRANEVADHQRRFLQHTPLRAIQWVNFKRHRIELRTLSL